MGRSQRRKLITQNTSTLGEVYAQGVVAPGVLLGATTPVGPPGGPLQGSSIMGAIPVGWTPPTARIENPLLALGAVIAAGQQPLEPPQKSAAGERIYPLGPFALTRIEPSEDPVGVWYVLDVDDGENFREGDEVLIEATGSSATNGATTVAQLTTDGDTRFFVADVELADVVEGKGRVTINAGAE